MTPQEFDQQNFQRKQQAKQQEFEKSENTRLLEGLKKQNDELVRTLKQYNDLVAENNRRIEERDKAQQEEMKKIEKLRTRFTIINIGIAIVGVIVSAVVGMLA